MIQTPFLRSVLGNFHGQKTCCLRTAFLVLSEISRKSHTPWTFCKSCTMYTFWHYLHSVTQYFHKATKHWMRWLCRDKMISLLCLAFHFHSDFSHKNTAFPKPKAYSSRLSFQSRPGRYFYQIFERHSSLQAVRRNKVICQSLNFKKLKSVMTWSPRALWSSCARRMWSPLIGAPLLSRWDDCSCLLWRAASRSVCSKETLVQIMPYTLRWIHKINNSNNKKSKESF